MNGEVVRLVGHNEIDVGCFGKDGLILRNNYIHDTHYIQMQTTCVCLCCHLLCYFFSNYRLPLTNIRIFFDTSKNTVEVFLTADRNKKEAFKFLIAI